MNNAKWIENSKFNGSVIRFKKEFNITDKIACAKIQICGLGWYESFINGKRTDNELLKPLLSTYSNREYPYLVGTYYPKNEKTRVYYNEFDITQFLVNGINELIVNVGGGWYHNIEKQVEGNLNYGNSRLIYSITIDFVNGTKEEINSDESTLVCSLPYYSTVFIGDTRDYSNKEEEYIYSTLSTEKIGELIKSPILCDKVYDIKKPILVKKEEGKLILDFGIIHSGMILGKVCGEKGSTVRLRYGEHITEDNELDHYSTSWGVQIQEDKYTLSGEDDVIENQFHSHCFRYVEICFEKEIKIEIVSRAISTLSNSITEYKTGNNIIDNIQHLYVNTELANVHGGVPTDCPHRERKGYTGDGQVTCKSTLYFFDSVDFYLKWYDDILDCQQENGYVPHTAPFSGGGGGYGWGYAIVELPYQIYNFTGNKNILIKAFEPIKKWISYMLSNRNEKGLIYKEEDEWCLGDWFGVELLRISNKYVNTIFLLKSIDKLIYFGKILGIDTSEYLPIRNQVINDINNNFYNSQTGHYDTGDQGADALALSVGIVPLQDRKKVLNNVSKLYNKIGAFDCGIMTIIPVLECLFENENYDLIKNILSREDFPSFGYMMKKGAKTLWESWNELTTPDYRLNDDVVYKGYPVSHCHPMFGSVVSFIVEKICGLSIFMDNDNLTYLYNIKMFRQFKNVSIERKIGNETLNLEYKYEEGKLNIFGKVPDNISLIVELPNKEKKNVTGVFTLEVLVNE